MSQLLKINHKKYMFGDNLYLNIYYFIRILMLIVAVFLCTHVAKVMFSCSVYVLLDARLQRVVSHYNDCTIQIF